MRTMKDVILIAVVFSALTFSASCQREPTAQLTYRKVDVGSADVQSSIIVSRYGSLWMGYESKGIIFTNPLGEAESVLKSVVIGFMRNGVFVPLAWYLDNGQLLDAKKSEIPTPRFSDSVEVIGISSITFSNPLAPVYVVRDKDTKVLRSVDPSAILEVDFEKATLKLREGLFN